MCHTLDNTPFGAKEARDSCYATLTATLIVCCPRWHKSCNINVLFLFMWNRILLVIVPFAQNLSRRTGCQLQNRLQLTVWTKWKRVHDSKSVLLMLSLYVCVWLLLLLLFLEVQRGSNSLAHRVEWHMHRKYLKIESDTLNTSFVCIDLLFVYCSSD